MTNKDVFKLDHELEGVSLWRYHLGGYRLTGRYVDFTGTVEKINRRRANLEGIRKLLVELAITELWADEDGAEDWVANRLPLRP